MDVRPTDNLQQTNNAIPACAGRAILVAVIVIAAALAAIGGAVLMSGGARAIAPLVRSRGTRPRAVVDRTPWDLGVIESGEQFGHVFTVCNQGDGPLSSRRAQSFAHVR